MNSRLPYSLGYHTQRNKEDNQFWKCPPPPGPEAFTEGRFALCCFLPPPLTLPHLNCPAQHTAVCHLASLQAVAERAVPRFAFDSLGGVWRRVSCWPDSDD